MLSLTPDEWTAVLLSLRIAVVATVVALPFGIAIAWVLARKNFWGKALLDGIVHLPLVLPPVVTGYLLLIWFGRRGVIGAFLGVGVVYLVSNMAGWVVVVNYGKMPIWIGLAVGVAVVAGLYPSVKAARLEPLETLRLG